MKESTQFLISGLVILIIGIMVIEASFIVQVPSQYKTFLGIPYATNPQFLDAFNEKIELLLFGVLFFGFGLGILGSVKAIHKLEKRSSPPPPPS